MTIRRLLCAAVLLGSAVLIGYRGGAAAYLLFWAALLVPLLALLCRAVFRRSLLVSLKTETDEVLRGEEPEGLSGHRLDLIQGKSGAPEPQAKKRSGSPEGSRCAR